MARIKYRKKPSIIRIVRISIASICWFLAVYLVVKIISKWIPPKSPTSSLGSRRIIPELIQYPNPSILPTRSLILYIFGNTHTSAEENLRFFIRTAVQASHDADYYFILQRLNNTYYDLEKLPKLPSNGYYIQHENRCFDLGTIGWFVNSGMIEKSRYRYFIFINASVRGPFIVSYYTQSTWFSIFTRRLNAFIKLTGSTISCDVNPHVQSYVWAMHMNTLEFFLANTTVFTCHPDMLTTILSGEVNASAILLHAGYGIDSLMVKYRGVDFRYNTSGICPAGNPAVDKYLDGLTVDPYEVLFVKTKFDNKDYQDNQKRVLVYEKWLHQ